jgi:hypothetical protein
LPCLDLSEGETLEQLAKKLDELLCGLSPGVDGDSIQVTPEPAGENCANGGFLVELIDGLDGVTVLSSYYICNALDGGPGAPGFSGRGVAVFVQNTEPNQTDFNNQYGLIEGFGQNGIPGSNQIKPGDIWIENCQ